MNSLFLSKLIIFLLFLKDSFFFLNVEFSLDSFVYNVLKDAFKTFSLLLTFRNFIMTWLYVLFFVFVLSGVH